MAARKSTGRRSALTGAKTGKAASKVTGKTLSKVTTGKMPRTNVAGGKSPKAKITETTKNRAGSLRGKQARVEKVPAEKVQVERVRVAKVPVTGRLVKLGTVDRGRAKVLDDVFIGATEITVSAASGKSATITGVLLSVLRDVASALEHGDSVTIVGADAEADLEGAVISSQEAADLLNVSRPYVVKLAKSGQLPHHMVGNRHRFNLADVLAHAEEMRNTRSAALAAIVPAGGYTAEDF